MVKQFFEAQLLGLGWSYLHDLFQLNIIPSHLSCLLGGSSKGRHRSSLLQEKQGQTWQMLWSVSLHQVMALRCLLNSEIVPTQLAMLFGLWVAKLPLDASITSFIIAHIFFSICYFHWRREAL